MDAAELRAIAKIAADAKVENGVLDKTGHLPAGGDALCLDHGPPKCPPGK